MSLRRITFLLLQLLFLISCQGKIDVNIPSNILSNNSLDNILDQGMALAGHPINTIDANFNGSDIGKSGVPLTYQCYVDTTIDGQVAMTQNCTDIAGITFDAATGMMDWTPSYTQKGPYEFLIFTTDEGEIISELFTINITVNQFISTWRTSAASQSITLPLRSGYNYNFTVDWGDGTSSTVTAWDDINAIHTYALAGDYTVVIEGLAEAWYFNGSASASKFIEVINLGKLEWKNFENAFSNCTNMTSFVAGDTDTSLVTNMSGMFKKTFNLATLNLIGIDSSAVTTMKDIFWSGKIPSSTALSPLNTSNVTDMWGFFSYCELPPDYVPSLNTQNATDMSYMFAGSYGQTTLDVSALNTSNVISMQGMFSEIDNLVQLNLTGWNTSSVQNMSDMFYNSYSLTTIQGLNTINTSSVTDMGGMFSYASALTILNLSNFNTSLVTDMNNMFRETTAMNTLVLNNWDIGAVTDSTNVFTNMNGTLYCDQGGSPGTGSMFGIPCGAYGAPLLDNIANQTVAENGAITTVDAGDGGDDLDMEGETITYSCYYDTAVDGSVATTNACTSLSGVSFNTTTGVMSWTPNYNQAGTYEFSIVGTDGVYTTEEIFTITVNNTNRPPVLDTIANQTVSENTAITAINAADDGDDQDIDGDTITYSCYYDTSIDGSVATTNACTTLTGVSFNTSTGLISWTPNYDQAGSYEFSIIGSDGSLSDDEVFSITVNNTNRSPSLDAIADQSATSGYAITAINANDGGDDLDGDGESLTYTCYYDTTFDDSVTTTDDCSVIGVAFNSSTGSFTWTPSYIQRGDFEFKIIATDGSLTDETLFQIDVTTTQFVAMYNITADGGSMTLPFVSGYTYNLTVDWGDGSTSSITAWDDAATTHTYATAGDYIVAIEGIMEALDYPAACNLKRVYNLGYMNWKSMAYAFETDKLISFVAGDTDTSQITDLQWTFDSTSNLVSADFTGFDTSSVTNMEGMFYGTGLTNLDLTSFDTRNVTNMSSMFTDTQLENLNVSSFRNNNVTNMYSMFGYSNNLTNINLTGFTTPMVTDMSHMFAQIAATGLDLSSFSTSNVTTFGSMFREANLLTTIDLSGFDTSSATVVSQMFLNASALTYINANNWNISSVTSSSQIFDGVANITTALYCDQGGSPGTGTMFGVPCN